MDQSISDKKARDILKQMETYQFDMPLKVSLIIDDSDSNNEVSRHGTLNVRNQTSVLNEMERTESTNISCFIDKCHDSMEIINIQQPFLHTKPMAKKSRLLTQLDTLSSDLIRVIQFNRDTSRNYNYDTKMYEKARENYLQFKTNIYNKSYDTTCSLILPLEKNNSFMKTFINRTLAIAQGHLNYGISEKNINDILTDLILWTRVKGINKCKKDMHNRNRDIEVRQITIHDKISPQLKEKSANAVLPTFKRHLYHKTLNGNVAIDSEEILPLKRQKIVKTFSNLENNSEDFNHSKILENEIRSEKRDNFHIDPIVYLNTTSGDSELRSPSCTNGPYDEMVFMPQNEFETIRSSDNSNYNITWNETLNASNSLIGQCSACGQLTTKMCLGCKQIYYCSLDCQRMEWPSHQNLCRR